MARAQRDMLRAQCQFVVCLICVHHLHIGEARQGLAEGCAMDIHPAFLVAVMVSGSRLIRSICPIEMCL